MRLRWGSTPNYQVQEGGGFLCKKCLGRGTGRGLWYRKGGGGSCARRGPGRGLGRVFLYKKGGSCGVPGTVHGAEGGGFVCKKGIPVGFLWHFLCTLCPHNSWQAFVLNVMQKAVADFLAIVVRVTPYWDLEVDTRRQRRKYIRDVVGAVLGDDDIVVRTTGNTIVIESSSHEVRDDDEQNVSEEVIQVLQTAHQMSLSTRNMSKFERNCTRREFMEGRSKLLPYVTTALEVSSGVVSRRSAAVCPLLEVVQSQLTLSRACGTFNIPRQDRLLIIICADATLLWQTSATKCDIHVTVWSEGVAAAGDLQRWRRSGRLMVRMKRTVSGPLTLRQTLIRMFWMLCPLWMFGTWGIASQVYVP